MSVLVEPFTHALEKLEFERIRKRAERYTVSGLGKTLLEECRPLHDRSELERQHAFVSEMRLLLETEDAIPIHDIRDIRESLKRATVEYAFLEPSEFIEILYTLRSSRALHSYFQQRSHLVPKLASLSAGLFSDKLLERHIELTVDEGGRVLDTASKKLRTIREDLIARQDMLRRRYASILKTVADKEFTMDDIVTQRDGRMVIPVKSEHKRKVAGVVHNVSQTGQTVFIEPNETMELNNEIISLQFEEHREISFVLRELTSRIRAILPTFTSALDILKQLDFLYAKGRYSLEIRGVAAGFSDAPMLQINNARHPLLIAYHGYDSVQPLTVELGKEYTTLVISGPNTGGKTVALKCAGLIVLMAQCGFHIPADPGTTTPMCDDIFVDIGDDQSVEDDLSTFSSHLKNIKTILEQSTRNSLVLIDEIGSGTDPNEGSAFAMSVLANLIRRGVPTIVTTHHGALKSFAHETHGAQNAGMEFDTESLRPTYRLHTGLPGSSYAFEIAGKLDFPASVLRDAKNRMGEQHAKLETLLTDLEKSLKDAREDSAKARGEKDRLEKLTHEYEIKLRDANKDAREVLRKAKEEARELLEKSRALVENTIRELREATAEKQIVIRKQFVNAQAELSAQTEKSSAEHEMYNAGNPDENVTFHIGDLVRISGSETEGKIVSLSEGSGSAEVQAGALKIKTKIQSLKRIGKESKKKNPVVPASVALSDVAPTSIDLRGMYGDEALSAVENFIAEAVAAGHARIEIIHGKGTGALRTYIHNLLKSHPSVASFRLADWNTGGTGATLVELKK